MVSCFAKETFWDIKSISTQPQKIPSCESAVIKLMNNNSNSNNNALFALNHLKHICIENYNNKKKTTITQEEDMFQLEPGGLNEHCSSRVIPPAFYVQQCN